MMVMLPKETWKEIPSVTNQLEFRYKIAIYPKVKLASNLVLLRKSKIIFGGHVLFDEKMVIARYLESLNMAINTLKNLQVSDGREPNVKGLNGWIFEQTIHFCLSLELAQNKVSIDIQEQVPFLGRVRVDLLVGKVYVELKSLGLFGKQENKYLGYRKKIEKLGFHYLYLTRQESYNPYREFAKVIFGEENSFFLDRNGDWVRFVERILIENGQLLS